MPKLIMLGIDGMDPYVFEKIRAELPNLSKIASAGCFKPYASVFPPDSIPAWVTIFTGQFPEQHGWLDNIDYEDIRRGAQVSKLCDLQGKTFWDQVGQAGKRVCIINPLLAYPVWPVNGVMTSGPVFITGEKQIYPPELASKYTLPELGGMTEFPDEGHLGQFLESVLNTTRELAEFGLTMMKSEPWDLFFISFFTLDRIQHFLWRFWDTTDPLYPGPSNLEDAIVRSYKVFDQIVGQFINQMDDQTGLMVFSDHGHGRRPIMLFNLNELLRQAGLLKTVKGKNEVFSFRQGIEMIKNLSIQVVSKTLGERWLYRIGRIIPKKSRKALKKSTYLIDKENSLAWASDMGGGAAVGAVEINPKIDRVSQQYKQVAGQILETLENANQGRDGQVVQWSKLREGESYYPDIFFELAPDFSVGRSLFCPLVERSPRHRIISGGHKKEGVFFAHNFGEAAAKINSVSDISKEVVSFVGPH